MKTKIMVLGLIVVLIVIFCVAFVQRRTELFSILEPNQEPLYIAFANDGWPGDDKEYMIPVDSEVYGEILELSKEVKLYYAKPLFSVKGKMKNAGTGILTIRFGVDYAGTIDLFEYFYVSERRTTHES